MSHNLYSGIVINQNQKIGSSSDKVAVTDTIWRYQDFLLPDDYVRGTDGTEQIIPKLSGFQLLVGITDETTAKLDWVLEYKELGVTWMELASGSTTGAHQTGDKVWMDFYFDKPIEIPSGALDDRLRIGIKGSITTGVEKIWLSKPNPESFANKFLWAYTSSGADVAFGINTSFNFRILGLVADEGTDFLGNRYRSVVISTPVDNTSTTHSDVADKIWMSKPNPSRFAVENLYFDVRDVYPNNSTLLTSLGYGNYVSNSSLEKNTTGWTNGTYFVNSGATITKVSEEQKLGSYSGKIVTTSGSSHQGKMFTLGTLPAGVYHASMWIKGDSGGELIDVYAGRGNTSSTIISKTLTNDWALYTFTFITDGGGACYVGTRTTGSSAYTYYIDDIRVGADEPQPLEGSPSVIDNVLIDPVTPGVWFNIYYSNDGDPVTTENDWDNKLWRRVPKTFHAIKRDSHKLPNPIIAKYIKIEFTHLQAQHYSPGQLARPISYKKHPKWVLDYFLAQLTDLNSKTTLLSGRQGVIFDAYDLAYNYYLDDIKQEPMQPIEIDPSYVTDVNDFLRTREDYSDQVDPIMASKISTALTPYTTQPNQRGMADSLLTSMAISSADPTIPVDYPVEYTTTGLFPDIIELRSSQTVFENQYPVMFFYLTCRHKYREITASLSHDRAYFVGIREVAFTRDNYSIPFDGEHYIESGADFVNTERNDFTNDNGVLVVS